MVETALSQLAEFRQALRAWLQDNAADGYDDSFETLDYTSRFEVQRAWQRKLFDAGWIGVSWPKEFGGLGLGRAEEAIYNAEVGRVDNPGIANDVATVVAGPALLHWGTAEQRARYLRPMLAADEIWCQGFSERGAGSDLAAIQTRADRDGDSFIVDGSKIWTTHGFLADLGILIVRTEEDVPLHSGLSALIVDMTAPGIEVKPLVQINGDEEFTEVVFRQVQVPAENLIGRPGDGWRVAMTALAYERATRANAYKIDQILRKLISEVSAGTTSGGMRGEAVWDVLADLYVHARAVRSWEQRQLRRQVAGEEIGAESSIGKLSGSELAQRIAAVAMDVLGPRGQISAGDPAAIESGHWPRLVLTSRYYTIASGTSEIQRNILSERVLGLPKG